jgi:hypothetical protein
VKDESLNGGKYQKKDVSEEVYRQKALAERADEQDDEKTESEVRRKEHHKHPDEFEECAECCAEAGVASVTLRRVIGDP